MWQNFLWQESAGLGMTKIGMAQLPNFQQALMQLTYSSRPSWALPIFSQQPLLLQGHSSGIAPHGHKSPCCSRHVLGVQQHVSGKGWVRHDVPRRWAPTSRKGNLAIEREEPGFQNAFTGPMLFQLESVEKKKRKKKGNMAFLFVSSSPNYWSLTFWLHFEVLLV